MEIVLALTLGLDTATCRGCLYQRQWDEISLAIL